MRKSPVENKVLREAKSRLKASPIFLVLIFLLASTSYELCFAQHTDDDESASDAAYDTKLMEKEGKLQDNITIKETKFKKPEIALPREKVFIEKIKVINITLLSQKEIDGVVSSYQNKDLSLKEIEGIGEKLTRVYHSKGYVTSFVYIPEQSFEKGILNLTAVETRIKAINIKGERYFRQAVYKKRMTLKPGDFFNYQILKKDIYTTNKHPDRKVQAFVEPSEDFSIVTIKLQVKDKLPFHIKYVFDNYASKYNFRNRYKPSFVYNNVAGFDDSLTVKLEISEANARKLVDLDYYYPLANDLKLEVYYMPHKREDYHYELEDVDRDKKAQDFKVNLIKMLSDKPGCTVSGSVGFGYWDILWYQGVPRVAEDRIRAVLLNLSVDKSDKLGRTIITNDLHFGIPGILAGLRSKDPNSFTTGAGSKFVMNHLVLGRRQKIYRDLELLFKSHFQLSSHTLIGPRCFCLGGTGGVVEMRAYPRADVLGDNGISVSSGFAFPAYFIPRDIKVPFSKATFYNSIKLFTVHDCGTARLRTPPQGQKAYTTLRSIGCGIFFSLPEHSLSLRVETFWPLSHRMPSDGDHCHTWISFSKDFSF